MTGPKGSCYASLSDFSGDVSGGVGGLGAGGVVALVPGAALAHVIIGDQQIVTAVSRAVVPGHVHLVPLAVQLHQIPGVAAAVGTDTELDVAQDPQFVEQQLGGAGVALTDGFAVGQCAVCGMGQGGVGLAGGVIDGIAEILVDGADKLVVALAGG